MGRHTLYSKDFICPQLHLGLLHFSSLCPLCTVPGESVEELQPSVGQSHWLMDKQQVYCFYLFFHRVEEELASGCGVAAPNLTALSRGSFLSYSPGWTTDTLSCSIRLLKRASAHTNTQLFAGTSLKSSRKYNLHLFKGAKRFLKFLLLSMEWTCQIAMRSNVLIFSLCPPFPSYANLDLSFRSQKATFCQDSTL